MNREDRALATDQTIWKNDRPDSTDDKTYQLTKQFIKVEKYQREYTPLSDLNGRHVQLWVDDHYWETEYTALGLAPYADNCTAAGACREYEGTFTYADGTGTFSFTHGLDFEKSNRADQRVELTTPIVFTLVQWRNAMKKDIYWDNQIDGDPDHVEQRSLEFYAQDDRRHYRAPVLALEHPTGESNNTDCDNNACRVRSTHRTYVDLSELNGQTLTCIGECLDPNQMNQVLQAALAQADSTQVTLSTPYYPVGDYFTQETSIDWNDDGNSDEVRQVGDHNWTGILASNVITYSIANGVITDKNGKVLQFNAALQEPMAQAAAMSRRDLSDLLRKQQYKIKPDGYQNNWTRNLWGFETGRLIAAGQLANLECDHEMVGETKQYTNRYPGMPAGTRYCEENFRNGQVETSYRIKLELRDRYVLTNRATEAVVMPSQPERFELTLAADEASVPTAYRGKTYRLEFQGFGELNGIPGHVINQCTGEVLGEHHDGEWTRCLRYVNHFVIPDDTILTKLNCTPSETDTCQITVVALRGNEFLQSIDPLGLEYSTTLPSQLPVQTELKDVGSSTSEHYIGEEPTEMLNEGNPCAIHGELVKVDGERGGCDPNTNTVGS